MDRLMDWYYWKITPVICRLLGHKWFKKMYHIRCNRCGLCREYEAA